MQTSYFPNRYGGTCLRCAGKVQASRGICFKLDGKWAVGCVNCYPSEVNGVYAAQEAVLQSEERKREALEEARVAAQKMRRDMIAEFGIELDKPFDEKTKQQSWSDDSTWKVPFNGTGSEPEIRRALSTPSESMYGNLRASAGVSVVSVNWEAKYIELFESVRLCD